MGEIAEVSPTDRQATRALAAAIVQSVVDDEAMPHGLDDESNGRERMFLAEDVESLLFRLAQEIGQLTAANAALDLVEHSELSGHIDIAEQCRDYLAHEAADDPSGKLQDFVESLRVVIDQLNRQRRSRNWYEAAYTAGKQKLIEHALSKVCCKGEPHTCDMEAVEAAEGRTDRLIIQLAAMTAARDEACEIARQATAPEHNDIHRRLAELREVGK